MPRPSISSLFPYTTLFRSYPLYSLRPFLIFAAIAFASDARNRVAFTRPPQRCGSFTTPLSIVKARDRKSTRLNSSHANTSYAVFCLKKKNKDGNDDDECGQ